MLALGFVLRKGFRCACASVYVQRATATADAAAALKIVVWPDMAYIPNSEPIARAASDPKGGNEFYLKT